MGVELDACIMKPCYAGYGGRASQCVLDFIGARFNFCTRSERLVTTGSRPGSFLANGQNGKISRCDICQWMELSWSSGAGLDRSPLLA